MTPRQFIFGPFLLGVMTVILGTMIYCSRPSPPPAVVVSPTLVIVAPTSTIYVFVSPSPTAYAPFLMLPDRLPIRSPEPTATSTPTPLPPTHTPEPTATPIVPMRQRG